MQQHLGSECATDTVLESAVELHRSGQLDQAGALYVDVLQARPHEFDALQLLGAIYVEKQQYEVAIGYLQRAIAIDDGFSTAHYNLGVAFLETRRYRDALTSLETALALQPNYADAHSVRANALARVGRIEEAITSCDCAIALQPDHELARHSRAILLSLGAGAQLRQ